MKKHKEKPFQRCIAAACRTSVTVCRTSLAACCLCATLSLLASCDRDNALYDTTHPTEGAILLHTGHSGSYYMKVQDYCTPVSEADFRCPRTFAPGSHVLSAFTLPDGMERTGDIIGITALPDGTLTPQPGTLLGNAVAIAPVANDTISVDCPLKQLTRRLTLKMKLKGGKPGIVANTEARITGLAPALDIATLTLHGAPATVRPVFTREGDMLTAELNLLGTAADARQQFTVIITATDGQRQTLTRDMTDALSTFNHGTEPVVLDATLELMEDAVFDAGITDWMPGGSEETDAV